MSLTSLKNKDVIKELEKTISPILVVNNSSLKPYVELFDYAPENIYQQPLGNLVGFFEVKEFSQESAYIVNFLTSVLKKEYYINPKRPVTESLDSALHKVNMALSELAKQGNIEWLGKLNAAICVLEKNNTHFSVSGDAKIFLYRNQGLSEISEDLASDSLEPHPLKTFVNVSSGRLEKDDRLLITSADIFHILTAVEIKKNFQRFEGDKFVQFLKTALSNQMEMIVSIVVEMIEDVEVPVAKNLSRKKSTQTANAFSEQTFANTPPINSLAQEQNFDTEPQVEPEPEYIDEKTGHIYVQGETTENQENMHPQVSLYWDMVKEKITQGSYLTKNEIRKRFSLYKKQLAKKRELQRIEKEKAQQLAAEQRKQAEEERVIQEIQREQLAAEERELEKIRLKEQFEQEQLRLAQEKIDQAELAKKAAADAKKLTKKIAVQLVEEVLPPSPQSNFLEKLRLAKLEQQRNAVIDLSSKNKAPKQEIEPLPETELAADVQISRTRISAISDTNKTEQPTQKYLNVALAMSKNAVSFLKTQAPKLSAKAAQFSKEKTSTFNVAPHFSRIGKLFAHLSSKQKLYTIGALALIFIAPLFIVHFLNKPKPPTIAQIQTAPLTQAELLANEKNIHLAAKTQNIFSGQNIITTLIANDNPALITNSSVIVLQNNEPREFNFPTEAGKAVRATYMNDLSLILILTDNGKVLSFSPISTKFADNNIDFNNISPSSFVGTYLTYLYVLDQKTNQIYRFPRADGGFGEKTSWLKDTTSLAGITAMTIDDNIYTVQNNQVLKFFKGKAVPFVLEASTTPIRFDSIYTTPELQAFYALDKENSRLVKFSKEGNILAQFQNETLKDGTSLAINETTSTAYITTTTSLISVSLQ
jgi:hypothetical protein